MTKEIETPQEAVERLIELYDAAIADLKTDLAAFILDGTRPDPTGRAEGRYAYPELRITWSGEMRPVTTTRAYGRMSRPGTYVTTVTRPALFSSYLVEQLSYLQEDYGARFEVVRSRQEIPYPYVLDGLDQAPDPGVSAALARWFPITELASIGDEIADGYTLGQLPDRPLALFDGLRTDYSLARLRH